MNDNALNIILFCDRPKNEENANTIIDHIDAFSKYSKHRFFNFSNCDTYPKGLDLNKFDALVIHYSSCLIGDYYLPVEAKTEIAMFKGLKILFIQDEYRRIHFFHEQILYLGIDILYTCVPEGEIEKVYPKEKLPNLLKKNTLTGYIPEKLFTLTPTPLENRPIDIGYRARKLPFWYGELGKDKWEIVDKFLGTVKNARLKCDLSYHEGDRLYGKDWIVFLMNCKAQLGVESGSSVFDFTGELEARVDNYQILNPQAPYNDVRELFFKDLEGIIKLN